MRWCLLLVFLLVVPAAHAAGSSLNLSIAEDGKITNYLNTYWVVNVEGTGTVHNPSENDLFDVRLFFDVLGLTVLPGEGDGEFDGNSLYFRRIPGGESVSFSYQIIGITAQPPTLKDKGVLYTGFSKRKPRIYSDVFGQLQKAPLEEKTVTGRDARLISVTFENPSTLEYTIESMRVLKSPQKDPNQVLDSWQVVNKSDPRVLAENGFFVHDFIDKNAKEGEVYWLQSDVYISEVVLTDLNNISRFTERNLTVPVEELNFTNATDNSSASAVSPRYLLRKSVSGSLVTPKDPVTVTLRLYNFEPSLKEFSLTDSLPSGFVADSDLSWEGDVPARDAVALRYEAVLNESSLSGVDRFPAAQARIDGVTVRSQEVPFVRRFSSEHNLYVQKRVEHITDDFSRVTISVRNLGQDSVGSLTIKEYLAEEAEFSQISEQPESKGVWALPAVGPDEEWSVSYVTDSGDAVRALPAVFGVSSDSVLRTLLLENVVSETWRFVETRWIELLGLFLLVAVPVLIVLGRKREWFSA